MMISNIKKLKNERGVILITTLLLVAMIAIFATALFARTIDERRQIEMQTNRIIAFQLAEAAVDDAMSNLANNSNYAGTGGQSIALGGSVYSSVITQPNPTNSPNVRLITSGTYWFDNIKISGNAKLVPAGPVTIYVTGSVDITGNGVTTTGNIPSNFMVNVAGEKSVKVSGNGTFYGVIYAPEAGGNTKIHYDSALANLGEDPKTRFPWSPGRSLDYFPASPVLISLQNSRRF